MLEQKGLTEQGVPAICSPRHLSFKTVFSKHRPFYCLQVDFI